MKSHSTLFLCILFFSLQGFTQLSESQYQQIDSLFIEWNMPNHPGGTVGIMEKDRLVFSKAYGLASLEYLVPNSTSTLFNIASVSKQFTAMGIVRLHMEGKLSVDDDIRKYLTELPDFGETITIRHMLHHTSGLRSLHALLNLAGWREDDARTDEDLFRFMANQRELNFKPGEEYLYCNTGYIFMARIIEKVTKEDFPSWIKQEIFEPLGMTHTYVEDNYMRVVPQNATSYYGSASGGFDRAVEYWGYVGSGNMHSTTNDLLKWSQNFYNPQPGWKEAFDMLQTLDPFNNGEENTYAFGVTVSEVHGHTRVDHGGAIGGFRSFIGTYPEKELGIVVLSNFSSSGVGGKAYQIGEILMGKEEEAIGNNLYESLPTITLSNKELAAFEASYWNDASNYARKIYLRNDTLRYFRSENNESPLVPIGSNEFQMWGVNGDYKVKFEGGLDGGKTMVVIYENGAPIISEEFEPFSPSLEDLDDYRGEFYSPELETTYTIAIKDETLYCHHVRHGDFDMNVLKKDVIDVQYPIGIAKFERDKRGEIAGMRVSNGRVRDLWFEKR
ncbi:MAG: serine hydrolase domain-containing protein [Bacteroidota bacterium]